MIMKIILKLANEVPNIKGQTNHLGVNIQADIIKQKRFLRLLYRSVAESITNHSNLPVMTMHI